ncbi:3-deoxy-manno-octulosonate cytidylyltransferase [Methylophaga nitratireducenticrescens]|uniref:3-deoxy-manno-octulosonate cytidylyltransferase n=1 Tax=Methylophaga nitratireducenticrescens TaxID=754476 RepID=I1XHS3_METNJ|nr:3-deoxy-manno-octulosonate cytidylyltransferase [Methylophaga nitratireducenticrescens]AFI83942.1 3-deoxy-manno-octulosonate cytidylyltransferase [Methylophaga nitratireducenticrescens]
MNHINNDEWAIIIPARYESSRFPGKPLALIHNKPMIIRVWERCLESFASINVYVATDDKRIADCCEEYGVNFIMTSSDCLTGTDRVYQAAKKLKLKYIINVQGDEPMVRASDIELVLVELLKQEFSVINAMAVINSEEEFNSVSVPKVVSTPTNLLMYMSRAAIPSNKKQVLVSAYKQVCIYGFHINALDDFSKVKSKTKLESIEDIEILRFLEIGYKVKMVEVDGGTIAVDYPEDLARVESIIK